MEVIARAQEHFENTGHHAATTRSPMWTSRNAARLSQSLFKMTEQSGKLMGLVELEFELLFRKYGHCVLQTTVENNYVSDGIGEMAAYTSIKAPSTPKDAPNKTLWLSEKTSNYRFNMATPHST